ncbi:MAG: hypothetical protein ACI9XC_002676 [Gammaproteobacteria bacterium]|jgi:hypothetical protein
MKVCKFIFVLITLVVCLVNYVTAEETVWNGVKDELNSNKLDEEIISSYPSEAKSVYMEEEGLGGTLEQRKLTLPFTFEKNHGQSEPEVEFLAHYGQIRFFLTQQEVIFNLPDVVTPVRMRFSNANPATQIIGEEPQSTQTHYLVGSDPSFWNNQISHYAKVRYRDLYQGIDLLFYDNKGLLEYDFIIAPGADPSQIKLDFTGIDESSLIEGNNVEFVIGGGSIVQQIPAAYQDIQGQRHAVTAKQLLNDIGGVSFSLSEYQSDHTVILDPILHFSRFFGGRGEEEIISMTTDMEGNIFITGGSSSPNLPISNDSLSYPASMFDVEGNRLAFVAKLDPTGTRLIYLTYLGGNKTSTAHYIKVDSSGNAYVAGRTEANDFPTLNPIQSRYGGGSDDVFISKLNADGSALIYSTYLGGSEYDQARSMALDSSGNVYVTGRTESANYPVLNPIMPKFSGKLDAFVTKVSADGSKIIYSTYLGGRENDIGHAITTDTEGNAYVTGLSNSPDFPTVGAIQPTFRGGDGDDTIVLKINAAGSALVYSTFIGGSGDDESRAIAVDASGNVIITGYTRSHDFPILNALQANFAGATHDIFLTSLNASGSGLRYSTYLGGSGSDYGRGLALDADGNIYLTGYTTSLDFPTYQPLQEHYAGGSADTIVMKLDPMARQLLYSSYLGGSGYERGRAITVDSFGNILVSGRTESPDFNVTRPASDAFGGGADEAFIVKLAPQ